MFSWRHMNASDVFHPLGSVSFRHKATPAAAQRRLNRERPTCNERMIAHTECGWKHGDCGHSAGGRKNVSNHETRIHLTPTGLLMEGDSISLRFYFASFGVNERNRDYRQSSPPAISQSASSAVSLIVFGPVMFLMYLLAAFSNAASNFGA